jgi:serine/threonine-protein kinase
MGNRHDRVRDIFCAALEIPADERAAYLDKTCGKDFELRADVERLIDNDSSSEFLPPQSQLSGVANRQLTVGTMVGGRFRIEQFISAGGMGEVYRALDTRLGRVVAIKVAQANFTQRF